MLDAMCQDYMSDCYIQLFSDMGVSMTFIPFDPSGGMTKNGKIVMKFHEDQAFAVHGTMELLDNEDPDISTSGEVRADGVIRLMLKEFKAKGIVPAIKDAIDVSLPEGLKRFVITGFSSPPSPVYLFISPTVTDIAKAFK